MMTMTKISSRKASYSGYGHGHLKILVHTHTVELAVSSSGLAIFQSPFGKRKNKKKLSGARPQPSHGRVPFVPWKCPVCPADMLSNLRGIAYKSGGDVLDVPGLAPKPLPGHFRDIPTTKFLCVFFVYRSFFSLPRSSSVATNSTADPPRRPLRTQALTFSAGGGAAWRTFWGGDRAFQEGAKKHPKKSNTKIFLGPPLPPSKFFVFAFILHFKEKKTTRTQRISGVGGPPKKRWIQAWDSS